jgi:hypothetical protein
MRYVREEDRKSVRGLDSCGNIDKTGSVLGMQRIYGWPKGGQVRPSAATSTTWAWPKWTGCVLSASCAGIDTPR